MAETRRKSLREAATASGFSHMAISKWKKQYGAENIDQVVCIKQHVESVISEANERLAELKK